MKLIEAYRLARAPRPEGAQAFHAGLACGFTPLHLHTFLTAYLRQQLPAAAVTVHTGLYGDLHGAVRDFAGKNLDAALIAIEWPDLDARLGLRANAPWTAAALASVLDHAEQILAALLDEVKALSGGTQIVLSLPTLPLPPVSHTRSIEANGFEIELRRLLWQFAGAVAAERRVSVLSSDAINRISSPAARHDVASELMNGFPYRLEHTDAIADLAARLLVPQTPKKGLITDLDDTLWRGLLGEEDVHGVHWNIDQHSQIHAVYQNVLNSLAESGVLVAIASKNDEGRVREALRRPDLILRPENVFPVEAHWQPKSTSVARILETWNIGADSVVFLDDSPIELAEVQAAYPDLNCILFPKDNPAAAIELFYRLRDLFGKHSIAEEDRLRLSSIRSTTILRDAAAPSQTIENLLRTAEGRASILWNREDSFSRALELVNKTNQFNLNGLRHTEASLREYLAPPAAHLIVVDYEDRFGKLGKVSVLAGRHAGNEFLLDTWVMSCRAFSRRIEYLCLQAIFGELGVDSIVFRYQETDRNSPTRDFLMAVCGAAPSAAERLSRDAFHARCPGVYIQAENQRVTATIAEL
jgi:FkbH-like protein